MIKYYTSYWKNAFNFKDRTSRAGYWVPWLITFIVNIIVVLPSEQLGIDRASLVQGFENGINPFAHAGALGITLLIIQTLWDLANFIPGLSIIVRRLHDVNKNWLILLYMFIPLVVGLPLMLLFNSIFLLLIATLISLGFTIALIVYTLMPTKAPGYNRWHHRPQV